MISYHILLRSNSPQPYFLWYLKGLIYLAASYHCALIIAYVSEKNESTGD